MMSTSQTSPPADPLGLLSQSLDQLANNPPMVPESGTSKAPKGDNEEAKILETEEKSSGPLYLELEKENLQIVQESS